MTAPELKAARERLGLSQAELARLLGLARRDTVWRWEQGTRRIPSFLPLALAEVERERLKQQS